MYGNNISVFEKSKSQTIISYQQGVANIILNELLNQVKKFYIFLQFHYFAFEHKQTNT